MAFFKTQAEREFDLVVGMWTMDYWPVDQIAVKLSLLKERVVEILESYIEKEPPAPMAALER